MFASTTLARRVEAAEAAASEAMAHAVIARGRVRGAFVAHTGGGVAVFTGVDAPLTKVIGVGFDGLPDAAALQAVEDAFAARGAVVRYEVASLAEPELLRVLTRRGFELHGFENVLGLPLPAPLAAGAAAIVVTRGEDLAAWRDTLIDGFGAPDAGVPSAPPEEFSRDALDEIFADMTAGPGFHAYGARLDGHLAGAAGMRVIGGLAQLCGAATRPAFRRRGVQTALLAARLRDASTEGCDLAVVTTQPGSRSQQNAQHAGFALLYTRAVLIRPAPCPRDRRPPGDPDGGGRVGVS